SSTSAQIAKGTCKMLHIPQGYSAAQAPIRANNRFRRWIICRLPARVKPWLRPAVTIISRSISNSAGPAIPTPPTTNKNKYSPPKANPAPENSSKNTPGIAYGELCTRGDAEGGTESGLLAYGFSP